MSLDFDEICLIKGLLRHNRMNQQQVIATFSFPDRTVHHNVISEIGRGIRFVSDTEYPPAGPSECDDCLQRLPWSRKWLPDCRHRHLSAPFQFRYSYHPVGQGMFCSSMFDRLGRNYSDVTDSIREFMRTGVVVKTVINSMTFDGSTTDPIQQAVRDALIAFMAATAQAQAEVTKEAQKAGIARAKTDDRKYPGRKPSYNRDTFDVVRDLLTKCTGASEIARTTGLSRQAILRIREDPASAETALARWGM